MKRTSLFFLILLTALLLTNAAFAAVELNVDELTLAPGETYEFEPIDGIVYWSISDESVLEFSSGEHIGVTALEPGTAIVFAMSEDHSEVDSCVVTVSGEAKAAKSAELYYQQLTAEDLAKVNDPAIASVLRMGSDVEKYPLGIGTLDGTEYKVLVAVTEGSAQKLADAADALGLADVWAFDFVDMTALRANANVIARLLIEYRDEIVSVETDQMHVVEFADEEALESKGVSNMGSNIEALTSVSTAHNLGIKGAGQYIAIIDTGIKADHKEFKGSDGKSRVAYQQCYSSAASSTSNSSWYGTTAVYVVNPVCEGGTTHSATSAAPSGAKFASNFNHGTHVAGIAAGKNGIAPEAKIIAVQFFTEYIYYKQNDDGTASDTVLFKGATYSDSEEMKALQYIQSLIKQGIVPAAVNMSYGNGGKYTDYVSYMNDSYYQELTEAGVIPCAGSGNEGSTTGIYYPAASKYTVAVSALSYQSEPYLWYSSNNNALVDILAPGENINSSMYTDDYEYNTMSGTSMATPMVSGGFALLRQMFPNYNAEQLKELMFTMSDKRASDDTFNHPVMNFANIADYYDIRVPALGTDYTIATGNRTVTVTLNPSSDYNGYKVDLYNADGKLVGSKTLAVKKTSSVTFSGLTNNSLYTVKLQSYKDLSGKKKYSSYTTETAVSPMTVPTGLSLTVNTDQTVTAKWTNNDGRQIDVQYSETQNGTYTSNVCTSPCTISGLKTNTVYYFRFRWYNTDCNAYSPLSAVDTAMILETPEEKTVTVGYKKIRVYFDDVNTLTGHQIKVYSVSPEKLVRTVNVKYTSNPKYADITGLNNGVQYRFEISAYTTVGKKTYYSDPATVYGTPQLKPETEDIPTSVSASGGAKKITVSWKKDTWTGGHYIELRRQDNRALVASAYAANNASSYTFSGGNVEYDVPYIIRVWKYNEKSPKAIGDKYVETYAVSLATPGSFNAVTGDKSIEVTWTSAGLAERVDVYYSTSSKGPFNTLGCTSSDSLVPNTCTIDGLTNGTLYYVKAYSVYELRGGDSFKKDVASDWTAVKSAVPLPVSDASTVTVKPGSKSVTVSYAKDSSVHGHIIQLYKLNGTKAQLVKTVTSADKDANVTVAFSNLVNDAKYRVTICSYFKIGKTTYRGALYTTEVTPSANAAASKEILGVTEMTEPFDGFVDPVGGDDAQSEEGVDVEIKEEEKQPSIFDLFRL